VGKKWSVIERRAEIMRVLARRRRETMTNFAFQFGVSRRTICYDIEALMVLYPIESSRGNGGCVRLADGYITYRNSLSEEEQETLIEIIPLISKEQATVIIGLLRVHGSKSNQKRIDGLII
jgi:predicted DNA-binding transcriptional regulator YafY